LVVTLWDCFEPEGLKPKVIGTRVAHKVTTWFGVLSKSMQASLGSSESQILMVKGPRETRSSPFNGEVVLGQKAPAHPVFEMIHRLQTDSPSPVAFI
jgi:hypothetical protein